MWLRNVKKDVIEKNITIKEDHSHLYDSVDILKSENNIFVIKNDDILFSNNDVFMYAQMISHISLCSHPKVKNILIVGYNNAILKEISKYDDIENIDIIDDNEDMKNIFCNIFSDNISYEKDDKVNFSIKQLSDIQDKKYDVIIQNNIIDDKNFYKDISSLLENDGIFISKSKAYNDDKNLQKSQMLNMHDYFKIIMPCNFVMPSLFSSLNSLIFASNKFHPTADIILNKADLLDDNDYYNADLHKASFVLPTYINKEYKNITKN
jgi:spermidine synthase